MDIEFVKYLSTLGIGGIIAGLMFMFYRKDIKQYTDLWRTASDQMISIVKENTASNTKLIALIETQERNQVRLHDIEILVNKRLREQQGKPII